MSAGPGSSNRTFSTRDASRRNYATDDGVKQVDPTSVVAKFTAHTGDDRYRDTLPVLDLPGHGHRREDCGDPIPRFCADCGCTQECGRTCYSWECPRCWKGVDRKRAATITAKLEALRRYRESSEGPGWRGWKFHHLVFSPPDGYALDADDPLGTTYDVLKEVCEEIGVDTGVLVYHPFRGDDGDDRGFWKDLLPDGDLADMDDTREELQFAPHFHAIVLAKFVPTEQFTTTVEEQTGWVVKRITKGDDSDVSIYGIHDLARVATYCLSHAGVDDGSCQYRYFGEVANFQATPSIHRVSDAAVRSVGVNTLGLNYDSVACSTEREITVMKELEVLAEKVNLGYNGDGAGEPETETIQIEEEEFGRCDGRMLDIKNAPAFLSDEDWCESAENVDELRQAWREWRERIDDDPDEKPPED